MKRYECLAIIFGLDGVLVDSSAYVERQWRRWASARGLAPEPFLRVCHGRRTLETIRIAAPHLDAEAEVLALAPEDEMGDDTIVPLAGAFRLLDLLPAGTWAVATSGPRAAARARLQRAGLPAAPVLISAEDVAQGKPAPDAYLLAARSLGLMASDCLVFEDAPAGIQAARSAGMAVVALATTHRPDELFGDACAASLAGVHLGRVDRGAHGRRHLEILVVEI